MADTDDDNNSTADDTSTAGAQAEGEATPSKGVPSDWRAQLESHLQDAKTLGGEIKGKLSDASKKASEEAKDTWKALEPQLENAEKTLRETADGAVESLQGMFGDLKGQLGKLRDKL